MQEKIIFREMLSEIKELADEKGGKLSHEEVKEFFSHAHLTEEQLSMVCDYLNSQRVKVEGYEGKGKFPVKEEIDTEAPGEEEEAHIPEEDELSVMYYEELEEIERLTPEEEFRMFMEAANGDVDAKKRLVEHHLKTVYELSMTYVGGNLPQTDLIQEGNIGLLMAMEEMKSMGNLEEYQAYIFRAIAEAMEAALVESQDNKEMDEEIAGKVNHLNEAILNLEKDLGHKVSVEELSVYMEMPVEEIQNILRMAGDEMKDK